MSATTTATPAAILVKSVKIQPSVMFSIFDQFQRRSELCTGRLIGAIFGTREEDSEGLVTICQAFPIPHSEINDQVNINSEYYKNRAELLRTCYGRSQYILGWYSISLKGSLQVESENFAITSSFIHDIFSKEVIKSSPVNIPDSAIHLEIVIDSEVPENGIKYSALMSSERSVGNGSASASGSIFKFKSIPICGVEYDKEETFVLRSILQAMNTDSSVDTADSSVDNEDGSSTCRSYGSTVAFPSAKEISKSSLKEFAELVTKLKSSPTPASQNLLNHLPDPSAYKKQSEKVKNDLKGTHELVKLLCDQLKESQKLFLQSSSN